MKSFSFLLCLTFVSVLNAKLLSTCNVPKLEIPASDLIIQFQQSLLNDLALDENYALILLKYEEPKSSKLHKAMFQVLNAKYETYYIGVLFDIKNEKPAFETFIQSKHQHVITDVLGLGKYTESLICPEFKIKMKERFMDFLKYLLSQKHICEKEEAPVGSAKEKRRLSLKNASQIDKNGVEMPNPPQMPQPPTFSNQPGVVNSSKSYNSSKSVNYSNTTTGDSQQSFDTRDVIDNNKESKTQTTTSPSETVTTVTTQSVQQASKTLSTMIEVKVKTSLRNIWGFQVVSRGSTGVSTTSKGGSGDNNIKIQQKRALEQEEDAFSKSTRRNLDIFRQYVGESNY